MRILFDTNIVLDVLLKREPWATEARAVWRASDEGLITGHILASVLTDIFYIAHKQVGLEAARAAIHTCLDAFEICAVDRQTLEQAKTLPGKDFEDNLQIASAQIAELDGIVTRNKADFSAATIPVFTPAELLAQLDSANRQP
jgi:predicted nucleic acid-binding protein